MVEHLRTLRTSLHRLGSPFLFHASSDDARPVGEYRRLIEAGVNTFYVPAIGRVSQVRAGLERFLLEVAEPLRASGHVSASPA
jgi:hypothetical protein